MSENQHQDQLYDCNKATCRRPHATSLLQIHERLEEDNGDEVEEGVTHSFTGKEETGALDTLVLIGRHKPLA
eukprot:4952157-Amphidinium_carterae.1